MTNRRFFNFKGSIKASDLCENLSCPLKGEDRLITGISTLKDAKEGDLVCCHSPSYVKDLQTTKASVAIVLEAFVDKCPSDLTLLISEKPYRTWAKALKTLFEEPKKDPAVSPQSYVDPTATLGKGVVIEPFSYIGKNVKIGDNTVIHPHTVIHDGVEVGANCIIHSHVTLSNSTIGSQVVIKPGARIGQQGFGFDMDENGPIDVMQLGSVIIGDNVVIGSNTTIDRGAGPDTIIGNGVRIDNLVQIAHNVVIGDYCVLVAQSGVAGSTSLGNFVIVAGQVGIAGHLKIGSGARIAAQSGVMRDVAAKETVAGSPSVPVRDWHKQTIALSRLIKKN